MRIPEIPLHLLKFNSRSVLLGNKIFMMFGGTCILIGLIILFMKGGSIVRQRVGYGFLVGGIVSFLNNFIQYKIFN